MSEPSRRRAPGFGSLFAALALIACTPPDDAARYLRDARFRRALLESTHTGASQYVRTRLAYYATGDELDWERRELWNPRVRATGEATARALALDLPLLELGREAFFRYPVQLVSFPAAVEVELDGGARSAALVCASCHTRGAIVGAPNLDFDYGARLADASSDPLFVATRRAWGRGRVDVASPDGDEPVQIPDLRPVRYQTHLQYSGVVQQTSLVALALRIETLVITSHGGAIRPPRQVALALATYLWSLAPPRKGAVDGRSEGEAIFAARCASCHRGADRAGPPVPAAIVGTDPAAARSPYRGSGGYRAPSLIGVADRWPLLHDGSVRDLDALLDPARRGGHGFTQGLSVAERTALHAYVASF